MEPRDEDGEKVIGKFQNLHYLLSVKKCDIVCSDMMKLADNNTTVDTLPFRQVRQKLAVQLLKGYSVEMCYTRGHTPVMDV